MRAITLEYSNHTVSPRAVPEPELVRPEEVLFRVGEVGVCGTDRELALFQLGYPPEGSSFLIPGHEAIGQVLETGSAVKALRRGDWVVPMVRRGCQPPCPSCARGRRDLCLSGQYRERGIFGLHGYGSEFAVDAEEYLVRFPAELIEVAVLIEPLSVVEKVVERALRLHQGEPRTALVLGAGAIGILFALALGVRGIAVSLHSLEPEDSPRARLIRELGARYNPSPPQPADIVIEATGATDAAYRAIELLAPLGVCNILGALPGAGRIDFHRLLAGNQTIFGSVNASPDAFRAAVSDLARFDRGVLGKLIHRTRFSDFARTLLTPPPGAPKIVHRVWE